MVAKLGSSVLEDPPWATNYRGLSESLKWLSGTLLLPPTGFRLVDHPHPFAVAWSAFRPATGSEKGPRFRSRAC